MAHAVGLEPGPPLAAVAGDPLPKAWFALGALPLEDRAYMNMMLVDLFLPDWRGEPFTERLSVDVHDLATDHEPAEIGYAAPGRRWWTGEAASGRAAGDDEGLARGGEQTDLLVADGVAGEHRGAGAGRAVAERGLVERRQHPRVGALDAVAHQIGAESALPARTGALLAGACGGLADVDKARQLRAVDPRGERDPTARCGSRPFVDGDGDGVLRGGTARHGDRADQQEEGDGGTHSDLHERSRGDGGGNPRPYCLYAVIVRDSLRNVTAFLLLEKGRSLSP